MDQLPDPERNSILLMKILAFWKKLLLPTTQLSVPKIAWRRLLFVIRWPPIQ
ncbi:AAEL007499-PA [Aedes aegypti]|uniref:AAEL007499-PA n=1 Tax=Aedes aegypti TaxID=7159 RepID=Q171X5_AEDAE|nr:AAEL007499-PA [Aedes aegypti]